MFGRNVFLKFINVVSNVNKSQCQAQILTPNFTVMNSVSGSALYKDTLAFTNSAGFINQHDDREQRHLKKRIKRDIINPRIRVYLTNRAIRSQISRAIMLAETSSSIKPT